MKNAKWWAFEELWVAVFGLLMGTFVLCSMVWKGIYVSEAGWVMAGIGGGAVIIYFGVLMFIGYVQQLRYVDEEDDEPAPQRPQHEARV